MLITLLFDREIVSFGCSLVDLLFTKFLKPSLAVFRLKEKSLFN